MRRLVLCALVLAGCGKSGGLGPNDVELTLNTRAPDTSDADLATIRAVELTLSGSQNDHTRYDLSRPFTRHETLVVHLTKGTGDLTIAALTRDDQGLVVALGNQKSTLSGTDPHVIDVDLQPPASGPHAATALEISPSPSVQVFTKQKVALTSPSPVTWSVTAGGAGGTVDDAGVYTAPAGAGSDEVVATSPVYFGEHASVTVGVLASGLLRYAGLTAAAGTRDGSGSDARINSPQGLVLDGAGSAYFTDQGNLVRKLDIASGAVTTVAGTIESGVFADGTGTAAGLGNPNGLAFDAKRNALYVSDNGTLRKIALPGGVVTTLAGANGMYGSTDGTGSAASFQSLWALAYDGNDQLYAADGGASTIRQINVATAQVTTLAGIANMPGYVDGPLAGSKLNFATTLALDGQGGLLVGDSHNQLIRKIDLAAKTISTVTGKLGVAGFTDGAKGTATINYPDQLAYDGKGTLYIAGRKIDVATGTVTTASMGNWAPINSLAFAPDGTLWAGARTAIATVNPSTFDLNVAAGVKVTNDDLNRVNGSRWVARFNDPTGITAAPDGTLLVREGSGVRRVDLTADTVSQVLVSPQYIGGNGNLAIGPDGTIYLPFNNIIYSLLASESYATLHTVAGTGEFGYADGAVAQARFACPSDVAVVGKVVYVADSCNNIIRAIDLTAGMVSTLAGTANMGGLVDMPGAAARFNGPGSIISDGNGTLYVASNNAVRKIVIAGAVVSTLAGGDAPGFADGAGATAKFNLPQRLTLDPAKQNIYVADAKNTAIRKVTLAGAVTTVVGGVGKAVAAPGALPAAINEPSALAFLPSGDLFVVVLHEEALFQIRLP